MSDGRTWRARAADHWTKACQALDPAQAYVNLMIAADCYARAVKADAVRGDHEDEECEADDLAPGAKKPDAD